MKTKEKEEDKKVYICKMNLKERGWTESVIRQFYPTPDKEKRNPHSSHAAPIKLYDFAKVKEIEAKEDFIKTLQKIRERTEKAQSIESKELKDRLSLDYANSVDIGMPVLERSELIKKALEEYRVLHSNGVKDDEDRNSEEWCHLYTCGPKEVKLAKISREYVISHCKNYDNELQKKFGKTRMEKCHKVIQKRIVNTVDEMYPWISKTIEENRRFLFIDTETTGLDEFTDKVVQVAWILTDRSDHEMSSGNYLVYPKGYKIPMDATYIHGITTKKARTEGIPLKEALTHLLPDWATATEIIGHTVKFDINLIRRDFGKLFDKRFPYDYNVYDTAVISTPYLQLPTDSMYRDYDTPSLTLLHKTLFGQGFKGAHDAMADAQASRRCFWELVKQGVIIL